ncbi:MAG: replication-relaxation family protein [Solirubrobacterales bacterium]
MSRVGGRQLISLLNDCQGRRQQIVEVVAELRLATGDQLRRMFFASGESGGRNARREFQWLHDNGLLHRLDRRIGGKASGSDGFVYALGAVGWRAVVYWSGEGLPSARSTWEPGAPFVDHTLATSELFARLRTSEGLDLLQWQGEPSCWRSYVGGHGVASTFKPDAFLIVGDSQFEHLWFIEADQGTERAGTIARKLAAYRAYSSSGTEQRDHGLFPHVLWLTPDNRRAEALRTLIEGDAGLCTHVVATINEACDVLGGSR